MDSNSNATTKIIICKRDSDIRTDIKGVRHRFYSNLIKSNKPEYNNDNTTANRKTEIIDNITGASKTAAIVLAMQPR